MLVGKHRRERNSHGAAEQQHQSAEPSSPPTEGRFAKVRLNGASEVMPRIVAVLRPLDVITERILFSLSFGHSLFSHFACLRQSPLGCCPTDSEFACRLANGQAQNGFYWHPHRRSAQTLPLRFRPRQPGPDTLLNPRPLELSDRAENVELQSASRCGGVDALGKGNESNPHSVQFVQQEDQVPEVTPQAIETPAHECIEPSPLTEAPPTRGATA